jgi:hypothetical protein
MMRQLVEAIGALAGALLLSVMLCTGRAAGEARPNIVLILADDVSADMFSCYGEPGTARTPNIDRIAKEGVMFRTCYAPAICANHDGELVAVNRRNPEALARILKAFEGVGGYQNYSEMLAGEALDRVIVASPRTLHHEPGTVRGKL